MTSKKRLYLILILGSLTALGPFSIDMYLPGFTAIAQDLKTTTAQVTLSLSSFFIGIAAGQLLYGPLLDRFGRKPPLYFGLALYILASAGCAFSTSIDSLIILRLVQAIGSCAAAVASVALVRDLFPPEENAQVFSLLILVLGVSPMLAPTIGGYVIDAFGWQSVFVILGGLSILMFISVFLWIPDTVKPNPSFSLMPAPIVKGFYAVLKEPMFYTYAFTGAFSLSGLLAYVSGSPQVFMEVFQVNPKVYGWIFAALSVGLIASSQVNSRLLKNFTSQQILSKALLVQLTAGIILFIGTKYFTLGIEGTLILIFVFLCGVGFTLPNTSALSMSLFTHNAGSASALMGSFQMGIGAMASMALSAFNDHTALPMATVIMMSAILANVILIVGSRKILSIHNLNSVTA
jgi:DHA1 family bicyclomycin/chloramphenicol resistance-like MFS transporter